MPTQEPQVDSDGDQHHYNDDGSPLMSAGSNLRVPLSVGPRRGVVGVLHRWPVRFLARCVPLSVGWVSDEGMSQRCSTRPAAGPLPPRVPEVSPISEISRTTTRAPTRTRTTLHGSRRLNPIRLDRATGVKRLLARNSQASPGTGHVLVITSCRTILL